MVNESFALDATHIAHTHTCNETKRNETNKYIITASVQGFELV